MNVLLKQCFIILINFLNTIDCTDNFQQELFGDGSHLGIQMQYGIQKTPLGIAHALLEAKNHSNVIKHIKDKTIIKEIYVPNKIINLVIK